MGFTNQEKQERFRKKEGLKKVADKIFRDWQFLGWRNSQKDPKDVKMELEKGELRGITHSFTKKKTTFSSQELISVWGMLLQRLHSTIFFIDERVVV